MLLQPNNHTSISWKGESRPADKETLEMFVYGEKAD